MKDQIPILLDRTINERLDPLDQAWEGSQTFAFVAEKCGVPFEWIRQRLDEFPDRYATGHFVLLTSGSTGRPKLVVGVKKRSERLAAVLHEMQESQPVRETVVALPLTYCFSFVNQWLWARIHRRAVILTGGFSRADGLREALERSSQAMFCLVGAQVPLLMDYFKGREFPGVIRVHFAGGRFPQERLEDVHNLFPSARIFNNYGCAEAMPRLTLRHAEAASVAHHIGWPLPGVELRADEDSRLLFRSQYGAVAYLDDQGWHEVGAETWVPTGDLGASGDDGHWEVLGREGEVFKRYGEKVSIVQVLAQARRFWSGQVDAYREVDSRGEAGYVLVLAPSCSDAQARELLQGLSRSFSRTHWPLRVESLPVMPLLSNGKVDRMSLAEQGAKTVHWKQMI